jgi:hypothetical protein
MADATTASVDRRSPPSAAAYVGLGIAAAVLGVVTAAIGYAIARPFQPGSAYTLALHGGGIFLAPGTFRRVGASDR